MYLLDDDFLILRTWNGMTAVFRSVGTFFNAAVTWYEDWLETPDVTDDGERKCNFIASVRLPSYVVISWY